MKILSDLVVVLMGPGWGWVCHRFLRLRWLVQWLAFAGGAVVADIASHDWLLALGNVISAAVALAIWWWRRKDRRRALDAVGEKSRALRDALVKRAREAAKPRPVLKPQPGGAS